MVKFCPNCGEGLDKIVNFCPNCGYKIRGTEETPVASLKSSASEKIICHVCGEENSSDTDVCGSCGARLENVKSGSTRTHAKTDKPHFNNKSRLKKQNQDQRSVQRSTQRLETGKLISIIGASAAVVFIILLLSGVFDSPSEITNQVQGGDGQSSQVDLQSIQKINELENQLKADPKNAELLLELAHLRNDSGFNEKAIEDYMQYLAIHPENADARVDMGVCYYKLQRYDEARSAMEKALEYKPDHQIAHLNLGIVNLAAGNLEKSREWLRKAVQINPNTDYAKEAQRLLESHTQ